MAEKTFLCKCTFCLNENINGIFLNHNTYNRHRIRIQEFSERDDIEIKKENVHHLYSNIEEDIYLHTEEDIQSQIEEDVQLQIEENIYQQEDDLDLIDDDDAESFDFNEEDIEYYSDYNNDDDNNNDSDNNNDDNDKTENNDDDKSNNDDRNDDRNDNENDNESGDESDDDESDDNDENDDDENDDDMQIDDETNIPNKEIIEGLKLLHLKSLYNFTESAYSDIMEIFTTSNLSLYKIKKYLNDITGLIPVFYDMCENSCICYTGQYESYQNCPICDSARLDIRKKPKKIMPYLSIIDRLQIQFNNENRAKELLYRYEYIMNKEQDDNDLDDIFDGKIYKELVQENLFNDKRDIVFTTSCDGYQIFKQKTDDCWLFLMINNNLEPSLRVKKENLMIPFLIPGPNQPKDFNTFLRPFIDEMKKLESKY